MVCFVVPEFCIVLCRNGPFVTDCPVCAMKLCYVAREMIGLEGFWQEFFSLRLLFFVGKAFRVRCELHHCRTFIVFGRTRI